MAADFIKIIRNDTAAPFAPEILSVVAQVRSAQETLLQIQAKGFRMFNEGPLDFEVFETNYGIPPGSGETVFNLINGTVMALAGTAQNANAQELINRVG